MYKGDAMTIKAKMQMRIKRSKRYVFMRDDFNDMNRTGFVGDFLFKLGHLT